MKIKKYEGRTLGEALRKVREDLGRDALILYTQIPRTKGWFGLFRREKYLIVAGKGFQVVKPGENAPALAPDDPVPLEHRPALLDALRQAGTPSMPAGVAGPFGPVDGAHGGPIPSARRAPRARPDGDSERTQVESRELDEVKQMVRELREIVREGDLSRCEDEVLQAYLHLLENNVSALLARNLVGRIQKCLDPRDRHNGAIVRQAMRNLVTGMIQVGGPIRLARSGCRKIALIGPTGVGKTTTIAKLAANFALKEQRRVAMLTLDTYRIAATDQLRKIAEIMDVPLAVVQSPADLGRAVAEFSDRDVILIDTAGRSQNDAERLAELRGMIEAAQPDEVHLVVSVTSHVDHFLDVVNRFSAVRVDRIILSKIDEASRFGLILDVLARVKKGISYLTTGQQIPQDIEPASVPRLAGLILGEDASAGSDSGVVAATSAGAAASAAAR